MGFAIKTIIVTGASGLIGPILSERLLNDGYRVVMTDIAEPVIPKGVQHPENAVCVRGDICSTGFVQQLLDVAVAGPDKSLHAIFILHGIMSAGSEEDFDLSWRVNLQSVHNLLLALRDRFKGAVRVVYSSSQAVYGQPLPPVVTDAVMPTPEGTYGAHKLATEIILNDMHRKGFLDVFVVRFPTLVVRPGRPSNAASSFLSGMIREPLKGIECVIPLQDRAFRSCICSPSGVVENLVRVLGLRSDALPKHVRHVNFPGISVSVQELLDALVKFGGPERLKHIREERIEPLERILRSWPQDFDPSTADRLGLVRDQNAEDLVREYVDSLEK